MSTEQKKTGQGPPPLGPIVEIEASWAPRDPRDRLYDDDATGRERTMSFIRILAAFHPVLNAFVLVGDMVTRLPKSVLFALVFALLVGGIWMAFVAG
ncbi:hypothetical protein [Kordiimonas aestuarii]|uniref:hypothetical protein n=1 Tax=Kordiimonas aestuarii TaxID=1005925 RepID=UPI0021CFC440|nr:hypothetical protein [Kordiimonas aestuarii]